MGNAIRSTQRSVIHTTCKSSIHNIRFTALRQFSSEDGSGKATGTVKWFDSRKGFGFIIPNDGSADVFVHHSTLHAEGFRSLAEGESVEYNVVEGSDGRRNAEQVTGPDGELVQGVPYQPRDNNYNNNSNDDGWDNSRY